VRQNALDRRVQFLNARLAEAARVRQRMDAGREQTLVHVNVAQPGQEGLIQQQGLDAHLSALFCLKAAAEFLKRDFERLRP
jgi:ethanolamine utilization microcompartment shell protein EutS